MEAAAAAVTNAATPAVRSSALKCLQATLEHSATLLALPEQAAAAAAALEAASRDPVAGVRLAASAALAALCSQVRSMTGQAWEGDEDGLGSHHAGSIPPHATSRADNVLCGSTDEPAYSASSEDVCVERALTPAAWRAFGLAAVAAASDSDKARANGMRAVACIASLLPLAATRMAPECAECAPPAAATPVQLAATATPPQSDATLSARADEALWLPWLEVAVAAALDCMSHGNAKTAWNACIAAARVLGNVSLVRSAAVHARIVPRLLLPLEALLRHNANYKVRIHAAHALLVAEQSGALPRAHALQLLDAIAFALRSLESPAECASVEGGSADATFPNFRYHAALSAQLRRGLVALLREVRAADVAPLAATLPVIVAALLDEAATLSRSPEEGGTILPRAQFAQV